MSFKSRINRAIRNRMYASLVTLIESEIKQTEKSGDILKLRLLNSNVELDLLKVKNLVLQRTAIALQSQITRSKKGGSR